MTIIRRTLAALALAGTLTAGVSPAFAHPHHSDCYPDQDGYMVCDGDAYDRQLLEDLVVDGAPPMGPIIPAPDAL